MAVEYLGTGNDDGTVFGHSSASTCKIGFFGLATPVSRRAGAAQATSLVATASSADVTTELKAALIEVMNTLTAYGLWKGAA